jgi:hypothetical protein
MGKVVWKIIGTGAAVGAAKVTKKLLTSGWTAALGKEPPKNPRDPAVAWPEAVGWAVASDVLVSTARLLAVRRAAAYYTKSAGHPPKELRQVS